MGEKIIMKYYLNHGTLVFKIRTKLKQSRLCFFHFKKSAFQFFISYKKLKKFQAVSFLLERATFSPLAGCRFLLVNFFNAGTYCVF